MLLLATVLSGCSTSNANSRDINCSKDPMCIKTELCDGLDALTLEQVRERFGINNEDVEFLERNVNSQFDTKIARGMSLHSFSKILPNNQEFKAIIVFNDMNILWRIHECKIIKLGP
jgi:hypothetical protein